jgi:hypothetical protein
MSSHSLIILPILTHCFLSLSAFRSGYGCQTALLKIIEDWKKALDENKFVAAILMDLSKAFDCLSTGPQIEP